MPLLLLMLLLPFFLAASSAVCVLGISLFAVVAVVVAVVPLVVVCFQFVSPCRFGSLDSWCPAQTGKLCLCAARSAPDIDSYLVNVNASVSA